MASIFISHSDSAAAIKLEECLRDAFPGAVTVFNTSRAASGLAAGAAIDADVMKSLREADLLIWLASPRSVRKSFWMAWELGAATAMHKLVIPARCYGLRPDDLPLLQGGRMAPDLGDRRGMQVLLTTIRDHLHLSEERIAEVLDALFEGQSPSSLWGVERSQDISILLLGERVLIENHSAEDIQFLNCQIDHETDGLGSRKMLDHLPGLAAGGRSIMNVANLGGNWTAGQRVQLEWNTAGGDRNYASVVVQGEVA